MNVLRRIAMANGMKGLKKKIYILTGIACFGFSGIASAAAVGHAQLGQCAPAASGGLSGVIISATTVVWDPPTLGGTAGCFITGSPTDITSSQPEILSGAVGNILNLTAGGGAVPDFLTFGGNGLNFVLTGFGATATNSTACDTTIGDSCIVAAGSPFDLVNTFGGVDVDFTALGSITDAGVLTFWRVLFTTQIAGETTLDIQDAILGIGQPATSISSTYSAALTITPLNPTQTPESSTLLLLGTGLIGLGAAFRRGARSRPLPDTAAQ